VSGHGSCRSDQVLVLACALLFVHRDHQHHGAGTALVQWGLDQAENFSLPAYLEAGVYSYPLYLKMGFHEINTITVKAEMWDGSRDMNYVVMLKNPGDDASSKVNGFEVSNSE
jgi:predicted N-acetyltransferase YhbS